jgi:hypothetical protein
MTLVFEREVGPPASHALVIGVGAYPHLVGGDGSLLPGHEGMGQHGYSIQHPEPGAAGLGVDL